MKYLITGNAGSGKSTIIKELKNLGYPAYNTDDMPEVSKLQDKVSGKEVNRPDGPADNNKNAWNWQEDALRKLLDSNRTVFVGASMSNQQKFYPLFDKIFALMLDEKTLRHRLQTRTNNTFGKHPEELARTLSTNKRVQDNLLKSGAIAIDATRSIKLVANEILSYIDEN
jgi:dephospho-CoA kinase